MSKKQDSIQTPVASTGGKEATIEDLKSIIDLLNPLSKDERARLIQTTISFFNIFISQ